MGFSSARNLGRDISAGFSPPRRMPISEAVKKFMRVPKRAFYYKTVRGERCVMCVLPLLSLPHLR